jgi:hypothetical protein
LDLRVAVFAPGQFGVPESSHSRRSAPAKIRGGQVLPCRFRQYTAEKLSVSVQWAPSIKMLSTQRLLQIIVVLGATVIMKLFS